MQHETWTITEIRDGKENEVRTGLSHAEALIAIRRAMSGPTAETQLGPSETSAHELSLAA